MLLVVILSLIAAIFFAITAVIQQHRSAKQPLNLNLKPRLILNLIKDKVWLISVLTSFIGYLFQASALNRGALLIVQCILVSGLVFSLIISALFVFKSFLPAKDVLGMLLVTAGIITFLLSVNAKNGTDSATLEGWIFATMPSLALIFALIILSHFVSLVLKSILQAAAAGISNALAASFIKGQVGALSIALKHHYPLLKLALVFFGSWELYALIAAYFAVLVLVQSSFQCGPIGWSLPMLTISNPVAAIMIGIIGFKETVSHSFIHISIDILTICVMAVGIKLLADSKLMPKLETTKVVSVENHVR